MDALRESSIVGERCAWARASASDIPAPIVSDEMLDELGRAFVSFGGRALLGVTFEQYVRRHAWRCHDPRAHLRIAQRREIDRRAS